MNFDKRFNTYDENAHIQKHVAKNLVKFLSEMGVEKRKKALEIGCGTGIFSKKFIESFLPSQLFLNDI
ncbi:malonyl-[acyl-carrier protein] O-methyltransferase BioC, partial [Fusobacterium mortiferum]|nr:malonyl-[acyl-carrier protein] O-methyltransferase BioC [Fusobacterium mortiferum]